MPRQIIMLSLLFLAACGAETVGTAAVGAQVEIEQARQAEALKEQVQNQLDAAAELEKQRLEQAAQSTQP